MRRGFLAGSLVLCAVVAASSVAAPPTLIGKQAPDFVLKGLDGANLRLSEYRGQVVLVNFWARWAGDSRQEMTALDRINTTYQRAGLVVLGISVRCVDARLLPDSVRYWFERRAGLLAGKNAHDDPGGSRGRRAVFEDGLQARR
jgi:thiol-disulfide isomerase/thioredoxin